MLSNAKKRPALCDLTNVEGESIANKQEFTLTHAVVSLIKFSVPVYVR